MLSTEGGARLGKEEALVAQMVKNLPAMQETQVQSLGQEDPLEKGMGTHSGILAWKIPRPVKTGGLRSMGLQRVKHDWATNTLLKPRVASLCALPPISWLGCQDIQILKTTLSLWSGNENLESVTYPPSPQRQCPGASLAAFPNNQPQP